jgi:class 3 adenylate cyclase
MAGELPLSHWISQHGSRAGLVFTDVVDSTLLLFERETVDYRQLLGAHADRARALAESLGGRLVDEKGDELLAAFPTATSACRFARELYADTGHPNLGIRAGVHFGTVRAENRILVGRSVHMGARVMQRGKDREIWLSDAARQALERESPELAKRTEWIDCDDCELKGVPGRQRLWRIA